MKKIIMWMSAAVLLAACSKKDEQPEPAPAPGQDVWIRDLPAGEKAPGDPTGGKPDTLFFSFQTNGKVAGTAQWDIAFTGIYNSTIISNIQRNNWMSMQQQGYDAITGLPAADYKLSAVGSGNASPNGWFKYDINTHVVAALPGRTILIKQQGKTVYKMEMISIYKGNPKAPTVETPAPYLHFRYAMFR
ncbi:HmuY family protein [Chitinophaga nivalis]|uniref:HmuY family protein n=1 Tax=Chitinophaga nivalis TaxID=2991709 RepID=A0ABT3IGA4_9BACT|nr:HmuY family protein [Chitinophaga nivalis]MCW3467324.1 HmuY family protein [Chitinophaga nivalis]MCW3482984.1 HmuY family protein [Chitinophaga nivalis]